RAVNRTLSKTPSPLRSASPALMCVNLERWNGERTSRSVPSAYTTRVATFFRGPPNLFRKTLTGRGGAAGGGGGAYPRANTRTVKVRCSCKVGITGLITDTVTG